ncbi:hypothetical protein AAKU55_002461 [Oxalobacteraceae bacterium GrIS 1.11]
MRWGALALATALAGGLVWSNWPAAQEAAGAAHGAASAPARTARAAPLADWPPKPLDPELDLKRVPLTPLEPAVPAAYSLAQAREHGDARTPPLVHEAPPAPPSAAELDDPKAYQQYEARQNMKLYAGYVRAADADLPRLRDDIERGRQAGISQEQIAKAEQKLRGIEAMRAQLLSEHPELGR